MSTDYESTDYESIFNKFINDYSPAEFYLLNKLIPSEDSDRVNTKLTPKIKNIQTNVLENEKEYHIELLVPGYVKDQITIDYNSTDSNLVIEGRINVKKGDDNANRSVKFIFKDFSFNNFNRKVHLATPITPDKITAKLEKGILYITAPKKDAYKMLRINIG